MHRQEEVVARRSHHLSFRRLAERLFPNTTPLRLTLFFFALAAHVIASITAGVFIGVDGAHNTGVALLAVVLHLVTFAIVFAMAVPALEQRLKPHSRKLFTGAKVIVVILIIGTIGLVISIAPSLSGDKEALILGKWKNPFVTNDRIALTSQASQALLDGENPYTHSSIILALEEFPSMNPTPLRQGDFADVYPRPSEEQIGEALVRARTHPEVRPLEFVSEITYPAGAFLFLVPIVALDLDPRWFYLLCTLLLMGLIAWRTPPSLRPMATVGCLVSLLVWLGVLAGSVEPLFVLFVLLGWTIRKRPWLAAICMGLAVTSKQTALAFILFYLVLLLHESGWRRVLQSIAVIGAVFLITNLPFIIMEPNAWFSGVLYHVAPPSFPEGIGIVSFATLTTTPMPSLPFTLLGGAVLIVGLVWYYFHGRQAPQTALLLAIMPFFFTWLSLTSYFAMIPLLVFGAVLIEECSNTSVPLDDRH